METIVNSINKFVKYLEHAQKQGTFSLAQSADIYNTIQTLQAELKQKSVPQKAPQSKSILETIPEGYDEYNSD